MACAYVSLLLGIGVIGWSLQIERRVVADDTAACEERQAGNESCGRYARQNRVCRDGFLSESSGGFFDIDSCVYREPLHRAMD